MSKEKVFVIVPCYNEAESIRTTLTGLLKVQPDITVVVINDGSSDRSADEILAIGSRQIVLLDLPFNCGIGTAVETGLRYAVRCNADYAVKFDGDGQHLAEEIEDLLAPLRNGTADVTVGSRFVENIAGFKSTFSRRCGIALFRYLSWLLTGYAVKDSTSGFRGYNKEALRFASRYYPAFDYPEPEENILFLRNGFRFREIPCRMNIRQGGRSSIRAFKAVYYMIKVSLAMVMAALRPRKQRSM